VVTGHRSGFIVFIAGLAVAIGLGTIAACGRPSGAAAGRHPGAAAASASPAATDRAQPSPSAGTSLDGSAAVAAALARYLQKHSGKVGVAVLDRVTGAATSYGDGTRVETASVVKLDILAALLWQAQRAGRPLSAGQRDLAEKMITNSDNDAASALWRAIGGAPGLAAANKAFELTQTTPGPAGQWGLTSTTAADQVRLLGLLARPGGTLSPASQAYALDLMRRVNPDQRWGVSRAAAGSSTIYLKNGWLPRTADRGRWIVNSVGRIVEPGHDWLVAVLSDHHATEGGGIAFVERIAALAVDGLRCSCDPSR
jgi:beta-lactamase class A